MSTRLEPFLFILSLNVPLSTTLIILSCCTMLDQGAPSLDQESFILIDCRKLVVEPPGDCDPLIASLIAECCRFNPEKRPSFQGENSLSNYQCELFQLCIIDSSLLITD